jgi:hypothetical protein
MCGMRKYEIRVYGASLCTVHERRRMHKNKICQVSQVASSRQ